jgi:heme oxygenase
MKSINIRQYTAAKHQEAEGTAFMKAVFAGTLTPELWCDFTFQKILFYSTIETAAAELGILKTLPGIERTYRLCQDYMSLPRGEHGYSKSTLAYHKYLISISNNPEKILAHLYVWHMGDLHGGQMIRGVVPGNHTAFDFENAPLLVETVRAKVTQDTIPEILVAFDWAIGILNEYNISDLE